MNGSMAKNKTNDSSLMTIIESCTVARGLLATLELQQHSVWIKKYERTHPAHLRILLQEVMEEILKMEIATTTLMNITNV